VWLNDFSHLGTYEISHIKMSELVADLAVLLRLLSSQTTFLACSLHYLPSSLGHNLGGS
jgi:hypothetical protein